MTDSDEITDIALAVGVTQYRDPVLETLPHGAEEVSLVLDALQRSGFTAREPLVGCLTLGAIEEYVVEKSRGARRVVLYWTGHGSSDIRGNWLFTSETPATNPSENDALDPRAVVKLLSRVVDAAQILMVLDCCGAGASAFQVAQAVATTVPPRSPAGRKAPAISFITATEGEDVARSRLFAEAFASALRYGAPSSSWPVQKPMLSVQDVADATNSWLGLNYLPDRQGVRGVGLQAGTDFFRNLSFDPRARDIFVDSSALIRRRRVLNDILGWLQSTDSGIYFLTGSMGTGKSSVITQLVEEAGKLGLSEPSATWVSIGLTNATVQSVTESLGSRLSFPNVVRPSLVPEEVVAACSAYRRGSTFVFDSLDEAEPAHIGPIVQRLLIPLATSAGIRVVVASRAGLSTDREKNEVAELSRLSSGFFDLDTDPDAVQDISRHVRRVLVTTAESPYSSQHDDMVARIADSVARYCNGIFLVADAIAQNLARAPEPVDVTNAAFAETLRLGMGGAIEQDLTRFISLGGPRVPHALTALAWAAGSGAPLHRVWPAMANAVADEQNRTHNVSVDDIARVIGCAGSYLTLSTRNGQVVYRLRHQAVATYLRTRSHLTSTEIHRRIFDALRPFPGEWALADDYVLQNLADHALEGGVLEELFRDPDFMVFSEPANSLAALSRMQGSTGTGWSELYARCAALLPDASIPMRVFLLESLAREGMTAKGLPSGLKFSVQAPCRVRWTTAGRPSGHRLIRFAADGLGAMTALRTRQGYRLAAASRYPRGDATSDGVSIELRDPEVTAPPQQLRKTGRGPGVEALAAAPFGDEDLLVAAYVNDIIEGRIVTRDEVLWSRHSGGALRIVIVPAATESLIATTNSVGPVVLLRITTGEAVRTLGPVSGTANFAVGIRLPGHNVVCVGTNTGYLDFFATDSGMHLGAIEPEVPWIEAVATHFRGRPVLVGTRQDGRLEVRDAADGRLLLVSLDETASSVESMCVLNAASASPTVVTGDGQLLSLWDCEGRKLAVFRGHAADVSAVCAVQAADGGEYAASASGDGSIRLWSDERRGSSIHDARTAKGSFSAVFPARVRGRSVVLADDVMRYVLIDGATGQLMTSHPKQLLTDITMDLDTDRVWAVASTPNDAFALTNHTGSTQLMWSLYEHRAYGINTASVSGRGTDKVLLVRPTGPLAVIGGGTQPIGVYTLAGEVQSWLDCPIGSEICLGVPSAAGDMVLVRRDRSAFTFHDPMSGATRHHIDLSRRWGHSPTAPSPVAAAIAGGEAVMVHGVEGSGTWFTKESGDEICLLDKYVARHGAVVTFDNQLLIALGYLDNVLLLQPWDGRICAAIPVMGAVHDVAAPEPNSICVVAANRILWIDLLGPFR